MRGADCKALHRDQKKTIGGFHRAIYIAYLYFFLGWYSSLIFLGYLFILTVSIWVDHYILSG